MVRRRGPRLTLAEKTELWRRWRRGESLDAIGRALGRIAKVVRYEVARTGGISPPARQRGRLALSLAEREAISRGLAKLTQAGLEQRDRSVFDRFIPVRRTHRCARQDQWLGTNRRIIIFVSKRRPCHATGQ